MYQKLRTIALWPLSVILIGYSVLKFIPVGQRMSFYWDDWTFLLSHHAPFYGIFQNHWGHFFPLSRILFRLEFLVFDEFYLGYYLFNLSLLVLVTGLLYSLGRKLGARSWPLYLACAIYYFSIGQWFNVGFFNQSALFMATLFGVCAAHLAVQRLGMSRILAILGLLVLSWMSFSSYILSITFFVASVVVFVHPWKSAIRSAVLLVAFSFCLLGLGMWIVRHFPSVHAGGGGAKQDWSLLIKNSPEAMIWFTAGVAQSFFSFVVPGLAESMRLVDILTAGVLKLVGYVDFFLKIAAVLLAVMIWRSFTQLKTSLARFGGFRWASIFLLPMVLSTLIVALARTGNINSTLHPRYGISNLLGVVIYFALLSSKQLLSSGLFSWWGQTKKYSILSLMILSLVTNIYLFRREMFTLHEHRLQDGVSLSLDRKRCQSEPEAMSFPAYLSRELTTAQYCLILTGWHPNFVLKKPWENMPRRL